MSNIVFAVWQHR